MATHRQNHNAAPRPDVHWAQIDTVLIDLDGTLLDLAFDNYFWREAVPSAWGRSRALDAERAHAMLRPRFAAREGTLEWYCLDFWSRELGLDVAALKRAEAHRIAWLAGAEHFLQRVRARGKRLVMLTNAHPETVAIKEARTRVRRYFDACISAHQLGAPKEDARFWTRLDAIEPSDRTRALFIDDSLAVLRSARAAGIHHLVAIARPDSSAAPRVQHEFAAVEGVGELA